MVFGALVLTLLTWDPYPAAQATELEALLWVKRPVLYECGQEDPCLRYDLEAAHVERVPPETTRVEWQHDFRPGDVLYGTVVAWRGECRSGT